MSSLEQVTCYDDAFFDSQVAGALRSARAVVPHVLDLAPIASVVDLGCGRGAWLRVFEERGVADCFGVDGDYVDQSKLLIDRARFRAADLCRPIDLGRRFDLALCLEVGEHLPARSSTALVQSLAAAAPLVLFSAAIPGQTGTSHINEQWPDYWKRRFNDLGYERLDLVRPRIWQNPDVEWWYQQNIALYATGPVLDELRRSAESIPASDPGLELIREDLLARYKTFRGLLRETVRAGVRAVRKRIAP
jgi:SAM-dependent methyltransferase